MIILVIPIVFALVMGILCMGPFGWIMLALGLEVFGSVTKPKRRAPTQVSPANLFILLTLALAIFVLIFANVAHAIDPHFVIR